MKKVSQERLRQVLSYDAESGNLVWIAKTNKATIVGSMAGTTRPDGYRQIRVDRENILAHRAIWMIVHGEWPADDIDHVNGNRADNRLVNLRKATRSQNRQNTHKSFSNTGIVGVSWCARERKFRAAIKIGGKQKSLGYFDSKERARDAYVSAKKTIHSFTNAY